MPGDLAMSSVFTNTSSRKTNMRWIIYFFFVFSTLAIGDLYATEESLNFGRFGTVTLYYDSLHPSHVVLFVSGDGGWNLGVVDMARELSSLDSLVVGIDITHYLRELERSNERCSYPAGDLEELSKFVQKRLDLPGYITPLLVGYSSGATLVYATLVQAPSNTFRGAISLGFCPDLPLTKPLCRGSGLQWKPGPKGKGYSFLPANNLEVPWIALQGTIDQVCYPSSTEAYVNRVKNGEVVILPKVGHGFSVPKNWMPQFKQAFSRIVEREDPNLPPPSVSELRDLPLVEVPSSGPHKNTMAVLVSGDGGWSVTDRGLSKTLAQDGIPVVGLNSLRYFWTRRTPEGAAKDLERILRYYLTAWKKDEAILIGYSMGADVLPFMLNRLTEEALSKVQSVVLIGPGHNVDFQFHFTNWLGKPSGKHALSVLPEVEKLKGKKILCFYGRDDSDAICNSLTPGLARVIPLEGGHRVGRNFEGIAEAILGEAR
jgi:type IV secretory pathway VirJ component